MATWSELLDHLTTNGVAFDRTDDEQIRILFQYDDGRRQKIIATRSMALGLEWCVLTAALGPVRKAAAIRMLTRSSVTTVGGICISGDFYLLRQALAMSFLDGPAFELYVRKIAGHADAIEREVFGSDTF